MKMPEYHPRIKNANNILMQRCYGKSREMYGNNLPEVIQNRLDAECGSICENDYSTYYLIAGEIASRAAQVRHPICALGTAGASLAAFLLGITEVNPLRAHYYCPACKSVEFVPDAVSGFDLPNKPCPACGGEMHGDGHNLPFESFAGVNGEREPHIEICTTNSINAQVKEVLQGLFPHDLIVRCGQGPDDLERRNDAAGGVIVCPSKRSQTRYALTFGWFIIPEAYKNRVPVINIQMDGRDEPVTEQDYIELREYYYQYYRNGGTLDLLQRLSAEIGVALADIPMNDQQVYAAFQAGRVENIPGFINNEDSLAGDEFIQILSLITPCQFSDLVRIQGFMHGTDVWKDNAAALIRGGRASFQEVIADREDVFDRLIAEGMPRVRAYEIMDIVRMGKGKTLTEDDFGGCILPDWFIDSCQKISYLWPRAHTTDIAKRTVQAMWFKLYYPNVYARTFAKIFI